MWSQDFLHKIQECVNKVQELVNKSTKKYGPCVRGPGPCMHDSWDFSFDAYNPVESGLDRKKTTIDMVNLPGLICKTSLKTLPWLNSLQKISKNWDLLLHVIFCGVVTGPDWPTSGYGHNLDFWGRGQSNVYKNPDIGVIDFNFVLNQSRDMGQVFCILKLTLP